MYNGALLSIGNSFVNVGDGNNNSDVNNINDGSVCDIHEDNCDDNGNLILLHYYL